MGESLMDIKEVGPMPSGNGARRRPRAIIAKICREHPDPPDWSRTGRDLRDRRAVPAGRSARVRPVAARDHPTPHRAATDPPGPLTMASLGAMLARAGQAGARP